jgi:hypothetical protein
MENGRYLTMEGLRVFLTTVNTFEAGELFGRAEAALNLACSPAYVPSEELERLYLGMKDHHLRVAQMFQEIEYSRTGLLARNTALEQRIAALEACKVAPQRPAPLHEMIMDQLCALLNRCIQNEALLVSDVEPRRAQAEAQLRSDKAFLANLRALLASSRS